MEIQQSYPPSALPWGGDQEVFAVLDNEGHASASKDPRLPLALVKRIYETMLRGRIIDERLMKLQRQGRIGFHVGAEGEEAAIVASAAAMEPQDWLAPCYREVAAALYRGLPLQTYIDNMYGNADDTCLGRQMPDHVTARDQRYVSVTAPIGTQITQAVGLAWASKLKREDVVSAAYFGDGATSSNDFHAAMNFAGVFKTPCLFLLRNNGWAISVPADRQTASRTYADKGIAYGVPAVRCDGNDALAVYATVSAARARAAAGEGPTLIELVTYRLGPHTTSDDPTVYRDKAEVEEHAKADPIVRLRKYLEHQGAWTTEDEQRFTAEAQAELKGCIDKAENTPEPSIASMFEDVYATMPAHLAEQQRQCVEGPRAKKKH
ncbi:MAG: thiamine pyrophosphate-dependent enzyme [Myxococcales bacterium]|nr:thiamine pyrophosphate-dependent enzyme [Myxococcales bacterium]